MYSSEISVNGRKIPIRFGVWVMKSLVDDGVKLSELSEKMINNPFDIVPKILFFGAVNASEKRQGKGISINDIYDWLDMEKGGLFSEKSQELIKLFTDQMTEGVPTVAEDEQEIVKKK